MRIRSVNLFSLAAGCALAGAAVAAIATLAAFSGYTSSATLRADWTGVSNPEVVPTLRPALQRTLSRGSLAEIITRPSLKLYAEERKSRPLDEVINQMRGDITVRVENVQNGRAVMSVAFRYPEAAAAQRVNQALIDRLRAEIGQEVPIRIVAQPGAPRPSLEGKRWKIVLSGTVIGLLTGLTFGAIWSFPWNRERMRSGRIAGLAAAGAVLGLTVAWLIPSEYVSTAVVRYNPGIDARTLSQTALTDQALGEIIRSEKLYAKETAHVGSQELVHRMRARDLQIRDLQTDMAWEISFRDTDPRRAQRVTDRVIATIVNPGTLHTTREVIDPANLPSRPAFPNRTTIVMIGAIAGLTLGIGASGIRRPQRATSVP